MLDGGQELDLDAVRLNIDEAEIVSQHFPILLRTLLLDFRTSPHEGALLRVVPMVNSSSERFESLSRLRPDFPRPRSITMIPWRRSVASLRTSGVWEHVLARLEADSAEDDARRCMRELRSLEALELRQAITGRQYRTLWGRAGVGDQS